MGFGACRRWVLEHVEGLVEGGFWSMLEVGFEACRVLVVGGFCSM